MTGSTGVGQDRGNATRLGAWRRPVNIRSTIWPAIAREPRVVIEILALKPLAFATGTSEDSPA